MIVDNSYILKKATQPGAAVPDTVTHLTLDYRTVLPPLQISEIANI